MSEPVLRPRPRAEPGNVAVTSADAADVAFCDAMLPRVSRTFALNIRMLGGSMRTAVGTGYLLCRAADTLEDAWPGRSDAITYRFELLSDAMAGDEGAASALAAEALSAPIGGPTRELMTGFHHVWRRWHSMAEADRDDVATCVTTMCEGMSRYARRMADRIGGVSGSGAATTVAPPPYIDTEDELHDYCWIVAGCVGVMLTRLFSRRADLEPTAMTTLLRLAPAVGEGLQLTNILLDWPVDIPLGRCHVPAQWLAELLAPPDLVGTANAGATTLAARLESLARAALARVPDYLDAIPTRHFRYRQFCAWPALWALASLRHARRVADFPTGPIRPRLKRSELWGLALRSALVARSHAGTRGVFESASA